MHSVTTSAASRRAPSTPQATSVTHRWRTICPLPNFEKVILAEQPLGGAAPGAHIDRPFEFQVSRARCQLHFRRIAESRVMPAIARKAATSSSACASRVRTNIEAGMAGHDLYIAFAVADRKARFLEGAREEDGKAREQRRAFRSPPGRRHPHHVLLGDADQPLAAPCGNDGRRCRRQPSRTTSLGNASAMAVRALQSLAQTKINR